MTTTSFRPRDGLAADTVPDSTTDEVSATVARSAAAAAALGAASPGRRRTWLDAVADALEGHADELAALADQETALGRPRLDGEVTRAAAQLRFYGAVAAEGTYLGATLEEATATTPRLVRVNQPLGPVAVFGASNF